MSWLFGGGNDNSSSQPPSATSTIEKLSDRILHATLLEDRRSAVQGLRGLAKDWQLEVGTIGMPSLIKVLKNDRMDVEIIKMTLETFSILFTTVNTDQNLGSMMTEIFVKVFLH
jgi:hypothetical protein